VSDNTVTINNRTFKAVPTSYRCGGSWAWVEVLTQQTPVAPNGTSWDKIVMIGCVCHHTLPVNGSDSPLGESGILSLYGTVVQLKNINEEVYELVPDDCCCGTSFNDDPMCPAHGRYGV
jgi:hypothetical protein